MKGRAAWCFSFFAVNLACLIFELAIVNCFSGLALFSIIVAAWGAGFCFALGVSIQLEEP